MINELDDILLGRVHADKITSTAVLDAYCFLTGIGVVSSYFSCKAVNKGAVCDFRYYDGNAQPFAFIVNQASLKFYFRKFAIEEYGMSVEGLRQYIEDDSIEWKKPPRREFTIDIKNLEQARKVVTYADLQR